MVTIDRHGIHMPIQKHNFHTGTIISSSTPLPCNYLDALHDPNWLNAMKYVYDAHISNGTWVLVSRPHNSNLVNCIWLFKKNLIQMDP